jgi:L-lactate utilization protein LutC
MSLKLQVNSLEALEKLIEGDGELEVQIKETILNKLAKSYIKKIENEEVVNKVKDIIEGQVYDEKRWNGYVKDHLGKEVITKIRQQAKDEVDRLIGNEIYQMQNNLLSVIKKECKRYVDQIFPIVMAQEFSRQVRKAVDGVVKEATEKAKSSENPNDKNIQFFE